jgi:head-tail adaptor
MQAGKLRHRLTFEEAAEVADPNGTGQRVKVWNDVGQRWGSVDPLTGKELIAAQQTKSTVTHRITIRNRPPSPTKPAAQLRVVRRVTGQPVRVYHLSSALDWESRGIETTILAEEKVGVTP